MAFAADKVSAHFFAWEIELTAILANFGLPPCKRACFIKRRRFSPTAADIGIRKLHLRKFVPRRCRLPASAIGSRQDIR